MIDIIEQHLWLYPVAACLAVAVLIPPLIRLAPVLKLVDIPDTRKQHEGSVPLIGGLIVFPVFIVVAILAGYSWAAYWPLYSAILLLLATGAADDRLHMRAWIKFAIQFVAAGLIIFPGGAVLHQLGDMFGFGPVGLGVVALPFTFAAVVLLINAVNLMDGLDGLAAGYAAVALFWIAVVMAQSALMVGILFAAIGGFLIYNLRYPFHKKASLFLGDAGSLCLGLCLAWFAIHACAFESKLSPVPISMAWILAIPIMDTCAQFYRRVREGRHPFSPDRGHLHHHFIHAGVSDGRATAVILGLAFLCGGFGVVGYYAGVPQLVLTVLWIAALFTHMAISRQPTRYIAFLSRFTRSS